MMKKIYNYLYLLLSQYKFFWSIQEKITKLKLALKQVFFYTKRWLENNDESYDNHVVFWKWSFVPTLVILVGTVLLQSMNSFVESLLQIFGIQLFSNIPTSDYITFLSAIAAIGGVFIALYFSSLSGINATLYSTFSNNLRDLLYREKRGNSYIKFLSYTTFFAFTLIVFCLLGYKPNYIAIPIMLMLIGITIFSYFRLGIQMHRLLNVDTLSYSIFKNLYKYIGNSIKKDIYNYDKNFQNHYYTLASSEIKMLISLLETSLGNYKIHNDSLQTISLIILELLTDYQRKKKLIPFESLWFKQKQEYNDIYKMGNFSHLDIFLQSATMPKGDMKSNLFWFEDELVPYIIKILINKIQNNEMEDYQRILRKFDKYLAHLVHFGNIEYAIKIITQFKKEVLEAELLNKPNRYELTQYVYSLPLDIILTFYNNISVYSYSEVAKIIDDNDLVKDELQSKFHENVIGTLDWLQKRLRLEYKIEDKKVTPKWYQLEIMMLTISRNFIVNIEHINKLLSDFFDNGLENQNLQLYSLVLTQKWEAINKYKMQFYKIEVILNEYEEERKIDGLDWKKFNLKNLKEKDNLLRKKCMLEIGSVLHKIGKREDERFPDIFGYFLQLTSDNLLELSIEKHFTILKEIYASFLISSFMKYEDLKPNFTEINELDFRKENEFIVAFHPIINLMEITGLIKVILEFYGEQETWNEIESLWLSLSNEPKNNINVKFIALMITMTESKMGIPIGSDQRYNWRNRVLNFLEKNTKREKYIKPNKGVTFYIDEKEIVLHESPLVRVFLGDKEYRNNIDGIDVFIHIFLNKHSDEKLEFANRRDRNYFEKSLERNIKEYEEYKNERK